MKGWGVAVNGHAGTNSVRSEGRGDLVDRLVDAAERSPDRLVFVELMDGSVGVESTVGAGSKFWVVLRLPVAESSAHGKKMSYKEVTSC